MIALNVKERGSTKEAEGKQLPCSRPGGSVVEHLLWGLGGSRFESRLRHTKGVKNGTSGYLAWCSVL